MAREAKIGIDPTTDAAAFTIEVPGLPDYAATARLFVSSVARHFRCMEEVIEDLKLTISEAVAFASRSSSPASPITISVHPADGELLIDVAHATGFDALLPGREEDMDPDTEFGVTLVRSLFPGLETERAGNGSRIRVRTPLP